jgi:hypothetical protein
MSRELARARLLTIDGYGHTAASNPSTCATDYEIGYMLTGTLPPPGPSASRTLCRSRRRPHEPSISPPGYVTSLAGSGTAGPCHRHSSVARPEPVPNLLNVAARRRAGG